MSPARTSRQLSAARTLGLAVDSRRLLDSEHMVPVVVIVGPTATGKTHLGLEVASQFNGEIINADALQVYRDFDIGTAKPTPQEQARTPHHLIDILGAEEAYSAGHFSRLARDAIQDIRTRGRLPLVVGGSGLYIRALLQGISPLPAIDPAVRSQLGDQLNLNGLESLYVELERLDPLTAARLQPTDKQRVLRALEVLHSTGKQLSTWIREKPFGVQKVAACQIGLTLPRGILYDRIAARVGAMVEDGWLTEIQGILSSGAHLSDPAFQALGYRQLASHLLGKTSLSEALEETIRATRRFAKRQMTWFRKEREITWFDAQDPQDLILNVNAHLRGQGYQIQDE